jgi:hypothetical protein
VAGRYPPPDVRQAMHYQEAYAPDVVWVDVSRPAPNPTRSAASVMRTAVTAAWALVALVTAAALATVVVVLLVRVVGALT